MTLQTQALWSIARSECPSELEPADKNVRVHVDLVRREENFTEPPKPKTPFQGVGRTLGARGSSSSTAATQTAPAQMNTAPAPSRGLIVDPAAPTTSVQLRLADGTRLVSRFNNHHTIRDFYPFRFFNIWTGEISLCGEGSEQEERSHESQSQPHTSLGPNGMNKMVINHLDKLFVTNDAATIALEILEKLVEDGSETMDVRNKEEVISRMRAAVASKQYEQEEIICSLVADDYGLENQFKV